MLSRMNRRSEAVEIDSLNFTRLSSNLLLSRGGRNSRTLLKRILTAVRGLIRVHTRFNFLPVFSFKYSNTPVLHPTPPLHLLCLHPMLEAQAWLRGVAEAVAVSHSTRCFLEVSQLRTVAPREESWADDEVDRQEQERAAAY